MHFANRIILNRNSQNLDIIHFIKTTGSQKCVSDEGVASAVPTKSWRGTCTQVKTFPFPSCEANAMNYAFNMHLNTWIAFALGIALDTGSVTAQDSRIDPMTGELSAVINVSNNPGRSIHPVSATDEGGNVHLVWMDDSPGNFDIFYSKWNGERWSGAENVSDNSTISMYPTIVVDVASNVHVTWMDGKIDGDLHIMHSQKNGSKWTQPVNISSTKGISQRPQIAVDSSGVVHAVWYGNQGRFFELYHSQLVRTEWTKPKNTGLVEWYISHNPNWTRKPALAAGPGNMIHLVWVDVEDVPSPYSLSQNVLHCRWDGDAWSKPENVSKRKDMQANIEDPGLCVSEKGELHVVWEDRGKTWYGSNNGNEWSEPVQLSTSHLKSAQPEVCCSSGGLLHLTWLGVTKGKPQVYYQQKQRDRLTDGINVSESPANAFGCKLAFDHSGVLHMTWMENSSGEYDIIHRRVISNK